MSQHMDVHNNVQPPLSGSGRSGSTASLPGGAGGSITFRAATAASALGGGGGGALFSIQSPNKRPNEVPSFSTPTTPAASDGEGHFLPHRGASGVPQRAGAAPHFDIPVERAPRISLPLPAHHTTPQPRQATPPPVGHAVAAMSVDDLSQRPHPSSSSSTSMHGQQGQRSAAPGVYPTPIDEAAFISDLLFLFMGVKRTKYICYSPEANRYEISSANEGSLRQRNFLDQIQEPALLVLEIETMLSRRGGEELSFLQQSLRAAIRTQMTQYHFFVATLRERPAETLVLADILLASKQVVAKLSIMSMILSDTRNAKGGALVSRLAFLTHQGSRRLYDLVQKIYLETVTPLLHMSAEWIVTGTAADPFNEFFVRVQSAPDVIASDQFWTAGFTVESSMLPTTVPHDVAMDILRVGRNIVMITQCCRAKQWQMDPAIAAAARSVTFATLPSIARDALAFTNKAVMHIIMEQYRLRDVFSVVQKFLLVGHGDFFEMLIRRLDPVLSKSSTLVQFSVVADHVQAAITECTTSSSYGINGAHHPPAALAAAQVGEMTGGGGSAQQQRRNASASTADLSEIVYQIGPQLNKIEGFSGWDCFSLTLPLHTPLNNIFDAHAQRVYRKLFKLLLSVKRAEVSLKTSWRQSIVLDRLLARFSAKSYLASGGHAAGAPMSVHTAAPIPDAELTIWRKIAGDAHLLGLQFNHFVTNLWSYFVSEVSATAWDKLRRDVHACNTFDELRHVHTKFLQHLTMHLLLHVDCREVRERILQILSLVSTLCGAQQQLTAFLERGSGDIVSISGKYQSIADEFQRIMSSLLKLLEDQHAAQFDYLNFLWLRLNFNQFYRDTSASATNTEF